MVTLDTLRLLQLTAILSVLASLSHAAESSKPLDRVRLLQPCEPTLVGDAAARSPTVRRLLAQIDRSDLIVFVRCGGHMEPSIAGRLIFLGAAVDYRFLLIEIRIPMPWQEQAAVLAHELQHAVEVAEAPAIRSQAGMAEHYARSGIALADRPDVFDTDAARRTGRQVLRELPVAAETGSARMRQSRGDFPSQR